MAIKSKASMHDPKLPSQQPWAKTPTGKLPSPYQPEYEGYSPADYNIQSNLPDYGVPGPPLDPAGYTLPEDWMNHPDYLDMMVQHYMSLPYEQVGPLGYGATSWLQDWAKTQGWSADQLPVGLNSWQSRLWQNLFDPWGDNYQRHSMGGGLSQMVPQSHWSQGDPGYQAGWVWAPPGQSQQMQPGNPDQEVNWPHAVDMNWNPQTQRFLF